ncbi:hypothetical protein QN360_15125, partial [Glaciimonas sp. CA11.2]|nr:hypothetical protein [Glaciimonas sp. CA11.2]
TGSRCIKLRHAIAKLFPPRPAQGAISKSLPTKAMAQEWTRKIEHEIHTSDFKDGRTLSAFTVSKLIDRYKREMQAVKPFGRTSSENC